MYQGNVQAVAQRCTTCGAGPFHPRLDEQYEAVNKQTVVEASWVCGECGSRFGHGIVEVRPDEQKEG